MRTLFLTFAVALALMVQGAWASPELRDDHPEQYTVQEGDTLWDISARFLKEPWNWPEIWSANPDIENPHLIYPGDVLSLVYIDGEPRIVREPEDRVIRLSPQIRETPIDTPIPTIPLDAIQSFLSETRIVDEGRLEEAPYIIEGRDRRILSGSGDRVYARGEAAPREVLGIFRRGERYIDPDTNEFLGLEARAIGRGQISDINGEILTVDLTRSREEIRSEDRLLPTPDERITTDFVPSAPDSEIRGKMIAVEDGVSNIGQYNVVTINRGRREGMQPGHVLAVYKQGEQARDPVTNEILQLPSERAGILMVFRTHERLSYGLVLQANRPLELMDEVRNP